MYEQRDAFVDVCLSVCGERDTYEEEDTCMNREMLLWMCLQVCGEMLVLDVYLYWMCI